MYIKCGLTVAIPLELGRHFESTIDMAIIQNLGLKLECTINVDYSDHNSELGVPTWMYIKCGLPMDLWTWGSNETKYYRSLTL